MKRIPTPKGGPPPVSRDKMVKKARNKAVSRSRRDVKEANGRNPDDPWLSPDNDALFTDMGEI